MPSALLCSRLQSTTPVSHPPFPPSPVYFGCAASSSSSSCLHHADPFAWGYSSLCPSSLAWLLSSKGALSFSIPVSLATGPWRAVCQWLPLNSTHSSLFPFPLHYSLLCHLRCFSLPLTYIFCFSPAILGIWRYSAGISFSYFLWQARHWLPLWLLPVSTELSLTHGCLPVEVVSLNRRIHRCCLFSQQGTAAN